MGQFHCQLVVSVASPSVVAAVGCGEGLELIYDQLHTHQLSLVAPPARRLVGRELGFDAAKAWGQNDDITVLTARRNAS